MCGYSAAIDMLLRMLTDEQLDQLLVDTARVQDDEDADEDKDEYCKECRVEDHDTCSMTDGCPCCDNTKRNVDEVILDCLGEES